MKTVLVIDGDGDGDGVIAQQILADGRYSVRFLTRETDSDAAAWLRALGADVVRGDLADRASLRVALKGCIGVFGATNDGEHGRNLMNAIAASEVEHFVLGTRNEELRSYAMRTLDVPATFIDPAAANVAAIFE
ncbi:MAG TPA: NmrA family NAD(P)-binding protein [Thermoanaerobaculia bacterium]|jgi:uncharacterized protein YbjT (DUF2867 family)